MIERTGAQPLPKATEGFAHLVRAIIFQQISGAAGASILRKVRTVHGGPGFPAPRWFLGASDRTLRGAGLSPQKRGYIVDLARHVEEGRLRFPALREAEDETVIETLTEVRGIGRWTAQMYLIFSLNRPDVLPSGDLGIRKAVQIGWGYHSLPAPRTVERVGAKWAPYRSYASYYLWTSLERRDTRAATTLPIAA
jgi:DNA-3-methyladenine glycosylase II